MNCFGRTVLFVGLVGLAGCAGRQRAEGPPVAVQDSDMARVPPDNLEQVRAKRALVDSARESLAKAQVKVSDARKQVEVAKADVRVAQAERDRAERERDAASAIGEPDKFAKADAAKQQADQRVKLARTRISVEDSLLARATAEEEAENRALEAREADLEVEKFWALKASGNMAAERYSEPVLASRATTAQEAEKSARERAVRVGERYEEVRRNYEEQSRQTGVGGTGEAE